MFTFSSLYLGNRIEIRFDRGKRLHEPDDEGTGSSEICRVVGKPASAGKICILIKMERLQAQRHVLVNSDKVTSFYE